MMDAILSWEGGRKENKGGKKPLVKLGKPHGHITWEKKASEEGGWPSSAARAVHCPTLSDILMDYKIGSPPSWQSRERTLLDLGPSFQESQGSLLTDTLS